MTEIPAMLLWTDAYLSDTSHLTTTEHGAYMLILMAMWRAGGSLPNDEIRLARTARLALDKWRKMAPTIMGFMTVSEGTVTQKRLKLEFKIASGRVEKLERAGRAGGRAKALKSQDMTPGDASQMPVAEAWQCSTNQNQNQNTPSSNQEPNDKPSGPKRVRTKNNYPEKFEEFWRAYPTDANMGKLESFTEWQRLSMEDQDAAIASCRSFKAYCASHPDYRPIHANRYLAKRRFDGFAGISAAIVQQVFVKIGTPQWAAWERWYRATKSLAPPVNKEGTGWAGFPTEWPPEIERRTA